MTCLGLWTLLLSLWGLHEIICKINIRWKVNFECHSSHVTKHNTEQIRVIFQFLIPRWLRWREVLQCASLPRCNPGTTCRWPGHRAFPAAPLGNGRSDSGYTGISTKRKHGQSDSVYVVNYESMFRSNNYQLLRAILADIHCIADTENWKLDTLCPSWHELPKSTILMALLLGLQRRMFSGFRSQWMMLSSGVARKSSAVHSCWANFRVRLSETPRKLVFRSRSYRLYESISNTRQRWFRNMKWRFRWTVEKQIVMMLVNVGQAF